TQMLASMTQNPRPTRAEVSDVANAIYDGTTAIMLSGESAAGAYPAEAVKTMAEIAQSTEESLDYSKYFVRDHLRMEHNVVNAVCASAYSAASFLNADAIVAVTRSGRTARLLSDFKPTCPVVAVTMEERGLRQLKLAWGIKPVQAQEIDTPERLFNYAVKKAQESGLVKKGSTLIVITSSDLEDNTVNDVMRICKI
nr:pyruvate kinase [Lachnospiraceae bacterium]